MLIGLIRDWGSSRAVPCTSPPYACPLVCRRLAALPLLLRWLQAVRRLWALVVRGVEAAAARQPDRPRAAVEAEVKAR